MILKNHYSQKLCADNLWVILAHEISFDEIIDVYEKAIQNSLTLTAKKNNRDIHF
jgi:hypothetical protein